MRTTNTIAVARLRWVALGAAELLAAHGEYDMATRIGVTPWLAWLFPIGLGVYAYCAFATRSRADVRAALGLMVACQALAHLLAVDVLPRHWTLVVAVSAVAPIICWRVHHLGEHPTEPAATPADPPVEATAQIAQAPTVARSETPVIVSARIASRPGRIRTPRPRARRQLTPATIARPVATTASSAPRRTREETRALADRLRRQHPGITQKDLAAKVGCTTRWLRACNAPA